jgi:thiamine biosynthesis lipoprotein
VAEFLESYHIRNYLVEIGGEIRARGRNIEKLFWRIGIDRPEEGNNIPGTSLQAIIELKNRSLATSGNYRKYYERNGMKFVHTINPATGYPVMSNLLSASVVADDCATADAYATSLMVFGLEKSIAFLKENTFLDAYLIYADEEGKFQVFVTPNLEKSIVQ